MNFYFWWYPVLWPQKQCFSSSSFLNICIKKKYEFHVFQINTSHSNIMTLKRARPWILELLKIASKQIQKILPAAFVNYTNAFVSWQMLLLSLCIDADTLWNHVTHLVCAWWVCNVIHTPALSVACRHTCTNLHMKCHYKYFITISH